ncbi:metal ABC transporter solute-binding protein, Zn/Mn family [Candidatus Chloroploca sp. Khr17]|uniref:metal ABC transporter solute-binding protein, Zn/Mn family n=1 Tax=Candidatus Chloroploca sp. Khr17 TaxID=2496869 RepID=UPI00101D6538|nr:zinc ABC transporter substrate-binding protein [Candidatus Chloroploca sp. Khr17]
MLMRMLSLIIVAVVLLAACGPAADVAPPATDGPTAPLKVVATTQQIADMVQNIAQDRVELTTLLGPGLDPHSYVATEGDLQTFQQADLILYNGLQLEAQLERVLKQIGERGQVRTVAVAEQLDQQLLLQWEPEEGKPYDPHIWNDVQLWIEVTSIIRDTLSELDPDNAAFYATNTAAYVTELEALHATLLAEVERIPAAQRVLVTAHDAFGYLGHAYGLTVEAVQGISTTSEASVGDIQALATLIVENNVPAIFVESTISPRTIEAVQQAVRAQGRDVAIGGELYSDAMGEPDTPTGTYLGMMRHNLDTIVAALAP